MTLLAYLGALVAVPFGLVVVGYCVGYGFQGGVVARQRWDLEQLRRRQLGQRDQEIRDLERLAGEHDGGA